MKFKVHNIKTKVLLGCVLIALMLSLSGLVAFFEFGRMSNSVSTMISDNIFNSNASRKMLSYSDDFNMQVLQVLSNDEDYKLYSARYHREFGALLEDLDNYNLSPNDRLIRDSIIYSYVAYTQVLKEVEPLMLENNTVRREWYFNRLQSVYDQFRYYLVSLSSSTQTSIAKNYTNLRDSLYRSIMPGIVAVVAGILLVFLFNYFLNLYVLTPIMKINNGLKKYKDHNKTYDVVVGADKDQLYELNKSIKELILENKALKRK